MRLWQLYFCIVVVVLAVPLAFKGVAALSLAAQPQAVKDECLKPRDNLAREACKELGR